MQTATVGYIKTKSGIRLRWGEWKTRVPHRKGTVVVLSGRREYLEKYDESAHDLTSRGYDVFGFDWRGQGLSSRMLKNPRKGFVHSYDDYLSDLTRFMESVALPRGEPPFVLMAHSMGAHIGLRYLHDHSKPFQRAVLTSPLIDIAVPGPFRKIMRLYAAAAVAMRMGERYVPGTGGDDAGTQQFKNNRLTSDLMRFETVAGQLERNPALVVGGVTFQWLKATLDSIGIVGSPGFAEKVTVPVLMVTAGRDTVVCREAQDAICKRLPRCSLVRIEGARHEIPIEANCFRDRLWEAFDRFMGE